MKEYPITPQNLRYVAGSFATGITVVIYKNEEGILQGLTANSFLSVSLEPPLVLFSLDARSAAYKSINVEMECGINILSDKQEAISRHFAGKPSLTSKQIFGENKEDMKIQGALSYYRVKVEKRIEAGDHALILCNVLNILRNEDGLPLLYYSGAYSSLTKFNL